MSKEDRTLAHYRTWHKTANDWRTLRGVLAAGGVQSGRDLRAVSCAAALCGWASCLSLLTSGRARLLSCHLGQPWKPDCSAPPEAPLPPNCATIVFIIIVLASILSQMLQHINSKHCQRHLTEKTNDSSVIDTGH